MGADFDSACADRPRTGLPPFWGAPRLQNSLAEEKGTHRDV
jgi:hypothetical protein